MPALTSGCGGGGSGSGSQGTQAAADSYRETFGEPPFRCETGYDTITIDSTEYDVTYCFSKEQFGSAYEAGRAFNTGCYVTETGQDVTRELRAKHDDPDIC